MTAFALSACRPDPDVLSRRLGEEVVLVHLRTAEVFTLNRTASRLWELIGAGLGRAEVEARLRSEFDSAPATLAAEVDGLLAALVEHRLVLAAE